MAPKSRTRNKYNARRVRDDNISFDSQREHKRYCELRLLMRAGDISELTVHPLFHVEWPVTKDKICGVELDFAYRDGRGLLHVEDVKGFDTALSKLKRRLVEAAHGVKVELVK